MHFKGGLPLWSAVIGHLGAVCVADPGMDVRCGWKNPGDGFGLVLAQRLADRAPVRHVENEFCSGAGGQQLGRAPRRVQAAAAMGFVKNRNASVLGDPVCDCKN